MKTWLTAEEFNILKNNLKAELERRNVTGSSERFSSQGPVGSSNIDSIIRDVIMPRGLPTGGVSIDGLVYDENADISTASLDTQDENAGISLAAHDGVITIPDIDVDMPIPPRTDYESNNPDANVTIMKASRVNNGVINSVYAIDSSRQYRDDGWSGWSDLYVNPNVNTQLTVTGIADGASATMSEWAILKQQIPSAGEAYDEFFAAPQTAKTLAETGCSASCTGLCYSNCYGDCTTTCHATCGKSSGNNSGTSSTCKSCGSGCSGGCYTGCSTGCRTGCKSGCRVSCEVDCTGMTSERCGGCTGTCQNSCKNGCNSTCGSACQGGCDGSCTGGCKNKCDSACTGGCNTACNTNCTSGCSGQCKGACRGTCTATQRAST